MCFVLFLRRHGWWLLPELVVIVAILTAGLVAAKPDPFPDQLAARAQTALEQLAPGELELYRPSGHAAEHGGRVLCAAEPFGTEPPTPRRIEDVRVIYAVYFCAIVQPGTAWDYASRSSGPAVITLTDPPAVQTAKSGPDPDRVWAMIPDGLEQKAAASLREWGRLAGLRTRYEQAAESALDSGN
ncbi:hypothetical protein CS0771_47050 [Catellatospora sp. IY07-71]|uniref:hypothetical protein n=1 Tax=Catellatospora sp. IY07-71 TaxID=2728827 RepID=UPI001BB32F40|nr:hypothetical protein [Catellatospora sp. IY07-71]BCJ75161.1 hypothetical protein CS0771_47050 [Catellatospora sp. IY07-71]